MNSLELADQRQLFWQAASDRDGRQGGGRIKRRYIVKIKEFLSHLKCLSLHIYYFKTFAVYISEPLSNFVIAKLRFVQNV